MIARANGFKSMGDDGDLYWRCDWCGSYNKWEDEFCWSCDAVKED